MTHSVGGPSAGEPAPDSRPTGTATPLRTPSTNTPVRAPALPADARSQPDERDESGIRVRFLEVPVDTYLALQEWNDAVVRECELIAALDSPPDLPARLLELAVDLSDHFARQSESYRDVVAHARAEGTPIVELEQAPPHPVEAGVAAADAFLAMMEELDAFCHTDLLLTEPAAPDVARLRRWFVTELRAQSLDRQPPTPFHPA